MPDDDKTQKPPTIDEIVGSEAFKSAIQGAFGEFAKTLKLDKIGDSIEALGKRIETVEKAPAKPPEKPSNENKGEPDLSAIEAAVEKATAPLKRQLEEAERLRNEAEATAKRERLESAARDALTPMFGDNTPTALKVLKADGLLDFNEDGKPGWKGEKWGQPTILPLDEGIKAWAKGEGARLLPSSTEVGGGGGGGGKDRPSPNGKSVTDGAALAKALGLRPPPAA